MAHSDDYVLGMEQGITRGDHLDGRPLPVSTGLETSKARELAHADWDGYGGIGDYANCNGNTHEIITAGHAIRDHIYDPELKDAADTGEIFDMVIVGGGLSGLSSAQFWLEATGGKKTCLILENHRVPGGEARQNEFNVDGQRMFAMQGSAEFFPPFPGSFLEQYYEKLGFSYRDFHYQAWGGPGEDMNLPNTPYVTNQSRSGFFFGPRFGHPEGLWVMDPWASDLKGAPVTDSVRLEWLSGHRANHRLPRQHGDADARASDQMTLEDFVLQNYGISREIQRTFFPTSGGGVGASADVISAYSGYAANVVYPWDRDKQRQMFPGGNAGIARHIIKLLIPDAIPGPRTLSSVCQSSFDFSAFDRPGQPVRLRLSAVVASVQHDGSPEKSDFVNIRYWQNGRMMRLRARQVVMSGGNWTTPYCVRDLPETHRAAYRQFHRSPAMVANVAVRHWKFMQNLGIAECQWFEGFGNQLAIRRVATFSGEPATVSPEHPTILTFKVLFTSPGLPLEQQAALGRMKMLSTSYREFERMIREQLTFMFARSGFDPQRDIAGIILNRWGHAYLSPQPGFFFGEGNNPAFREVLRSGPFGRIGFANCDLTGIMDHRASIDEAKRCIAQMVV